MNIKYINSQKTTTLIQNQTPYITSTAFADIEFIHHGFSTRLGGNSKDFFESMNLSYTVDDQKSNVSSNFEIMAKEFNIHTQNMVLADQTHTCNVMKVEDAHRGMGIIRERDFSNVDGLITNITGITLVTSHADCVPLYIVDLKNKAIGLAHAGWRGTVGNIAKQTFIAMEKYYNTHAEDVMVFIGPSICKSCYEIEWDVASIFKEKYSETDFQQIISIKSNNKYLLDLHKANMLNFIKLGVTIDKISTSDICTCCNPELLFSHRASHGKRGGMCAFLTLL